MARTRKARSEGWCRFNRAGAQWHYYRPVSRVGADKFRPVWRSLCGDSAINVSTGLKGHRTDLAATCPQCLPALCNPDRLGA